VTSPKSTAIGVSTDSWAMLLREGTRLFVPPMPPLPLSPNPFYALSENSCLGPVLGSQSTAAWGDESFVASSVEEECTDLAVGGVLGEEGTWNEEAMWVEPLAVSYPALEENKEKLPQVDAPGVHVNSLEGPAAIKGL
jgi:hypothetical protein